jgi:hypothetical protein
MRSSSVRQRRWSKRCRLDAQQVTVERQRALLVAAPRV